MLEYHFDSARKFCRLQLGELTPERIRYLIAFLRTVKQVQTNFLIVDIGPDLPAAAVPKTVRDRLEWSKSGQLLTNLMESLPFPVVSVIHRACADEYLEIALSCHRVWVAAQSSLAFSYGDATDFPRFGSLKRMHAELGDRLFAMLQEDGGMHQAWEELLSSRRQQRFDEQEGLDRLLEDYAARISRRSIISRRLMAYQHAKPPTEKSPLDYLEATIYANGPFLENLESVAYLREDQLRGSIKQSAGDSGLVAGLDDIGNDYMKFTSYPDQELALLRKKSRIEEVQMLLHQSIAPIRGRCIELGSGYGYFSALASKSPEVTEAVALDISAAEIFQLGPLMWEHLQPDWMKFGLRISDMNKLVDEYGSYDTVIFCASLHHSSDIPQSLNTAYNLLRPGGSLIIHGEHYDPMFLSPKKRRAGNSVPHTIRDFSCLLRRSGFVPKVYRYALPGNRFPRLKKLLLTIRPFSYLNGWVRFHSFMMLGTKA